MIRKIVTVGLWSAFALSAQTAQTTSFRAVMSSTGVDSGTADLALHLVKDASGAIVSASVDFYLAYQFPNDTSVTGLGIAPVGGGADFLVGTDITASSPVQATAGSGRIFRQVQVPPGNQAGLAILKALLASPGGYSVSVATADRPAGDMSGQLETSNTAVLMATLSSATATGVASVIVTYSGLSYAITSAEVTIQVSYQFPAQVTFSSMRVYTQKGQLAVPAELMPGTLSSAGGAGVLAAPAAEIDMRDVQMVESVQNILTGPTNFTVQVGTVESPTAALTGQLRGTDYTTFQIPGFSNSSAASVVGLHSLRASSGSVLAATAVFDINYRLAAGAQISQLDIDGNVIAPAVTTDPSGSGNAYTMIGVFNGSGLTSLNDIVSNPETHRIDLRTSSGTAQSAALAAVNDTAPVVAAVIPLWTAGDVLTLAPGELVEIYGTNLAKVSTDLTGWPGGFLPSRLNGVSVLLSGHGARLLYVSPGQVDALLPFGSTTGSQALTLTNANGTSAPISLNLAAAAPALFFFAYKNADFSPVTASNPAHAGDTLVFYTTGMGQTTPVLGTGQIVPLGPPFYYTAPVTVTIGGVDASVIYSIAAPPYVAGLYQMAITVPAGLGSGSWPVVATSGGIPSNTVNIAIE